MILATYDGNEGQATIELHELFSKFEEAVYEAAADNLGPGPVSGTAHKSASTGDELTASDVLLREIKELQGDDSEAGADGDDRAALTLPSHLETVRTSCKGVVMLRIGAKPCGVDSPAYVDPLQVVGALFSDLRTTQAPCSRHLVRVVPLQLTCFAGADEILETLEPLVARAFGPGCPAVTFMVHLKRRNNHKV